ncbi:MAG: hypothetical protein EP344_06790 [Bacteroidetes bacterium]|nr:MAG: hypothetical protein EP344_06790 [Bacteroidota bacterium]
MQYLLELAYFPPVPWMAAAWHSSILHLESAEHFQKSSYRNRCHIAGPNGLQRLSIPLEKGKHQQSPIREVRIAYRENWQVNHWRSILTAYGNAPFFDHFIADLEPFFRRKYRFLFDLNLDILHYLLGRLGWKGTLQLTETYRFALEADTIVDLRNSITPKPATPLLWYRALPYPQVFTERHGFIPDLSVLDLLMCCGKQTVAILQESLILPDTETN